MNAFDSDVLIYAIVPGHELGRRVRALFAQQTFEGTDLIVGIGSVLLLPELLTKLSREQSVSESQSLEHCSADLTCVQPISRRRSW